MDIALCSTLFVQIAVASTTVVGLYLHRRREKEKKKRFPTDLNCWLIVVVRRKKKLFVDLSLPGREKKKKEPPTFGSLPSSRGELANRNVVDCSAG
jgi:hypothetical protein